MASITISDVTNIKLVSGETNTIFSGEAIGKGAAARFDDTSGKLMLANATTADEAQVEGITLNKVSTPNEAVTIAKSGALVDFDGLLDNADFGDNIFLSNTDGVLDDAAAGTVSTVVGTVFPLTRFGATARKVLKVA